MSETGRSSKAKWIVAVISIAIIGSLAVLLAIGMREARHAANRLSSYGLLCQMRLALRNYELAYGTLPLLEYPDDNGIPRQSWRLSVSPYIQGQRREYWKEIDCTEPWDSLHNRKIIEEVPLRDWIPFARNISGKGLDSYPVYTHIMALRGADSAWYAQTGMPKGPIAENWDAILLVSVPESTIEPLQPGDITEDELRKMIEDGKEVYYVRAGGRHTYGIVMLEDGKLVFRNYSEFLD